MDLEKTGKFISELREKKKLTQAELGELVGVTGKAVSKWEHGQSFPDVSNLNKLGEVLGVSATELLNGGYLDIQNHKNIEDVARNIDDVTENSINFYKEKTRKKFHRIIVGLLVVILGLAALILVIFLVNNYNKCQVYTISSENSEFGLSGILSVTNKKNILMISGLKYFGTDVKEVYAVEYSLVHDEEIYYQSGDINMIDYDPNLKSVNMKELLSKVVINITDEKKDLVLKKMIGGHLVIKIDYVADDGDIYSHSIPLSLKREFSNSKLIY